LASPFVLPEDPARTGRPRGAGSGAAAPAARPARVPHLLYAVAAWSSLRWLHRVEHPSLIVAGEADPSAPLRNAGLLDARMPNARLHLVKGGGHLFLRDEPQNVVGPITACLEED
jgi:poly(3-hydroxyoctanoate) depolymerase